MLLNRNILKIREPYRGICTYGGYRYYFTIISTSYDKWEKYRKLGITVGIFTWKCNWKS